MIKSFKDQELEDFYFQGTTARGIPKAIEGALRRKAIDLYLDPHEYK